MIILTGAELVRAANQAGVPRARPNLRMQVSCRLLRFTASREAEPEFKFSHEADRPDACVNHRPPVQHEPGHGDVHWHLPKAVEARLRRSSPKQPAKPNPFCVGWDTNANYIYWSQRHNKVSPVVAGVIGAIVTLAVAGIIFGLVMFFAGVRFHRRKSELRNYKGNQKLASDTDLVIPKGGAVVGAAVETPGSPRGGHERVGSWELKHKEDYPNIAAPTAAARRPSFEDDHIDDIGAPPYRRPTEPSERV